jgi:hypothetical protein
MRYINDSRYLELSSQIDGAGQKRLAGLRNRHFALSHVRELRKALDQSNYISITIKL